MQINYLGDQALLITLNRDDATPHAIAATLDNEKIPEILDIVPALESVTVHIKPRSLTPTDVLDYIRRGSLQGQPSHPHHHQLPIRYDGLDLESIAQTCGISIDNVVRLHSQAIFTVAMIGFLPGFPYLVGLPKALHIPRRPTPRIRVPAGSVAIANDQTGIYPQASPGGWHIIGTTSAILFDPLRDPPTLLRSGDTVRFDPV